MMIDSFALLDEPRQPWLDAEALKEKFLARAAAMHPDRVHGSTPAEKEEASRRYAELNGAHARLSDTKDRLAHLLELELGRRPPDVQQVPVTAMDLFFKVGQLCRETDQFLAGRGQATSPMLKVQSFERGLELADRISGLQRVLREAMDAIEAQLRTLNAAWLAAPAAGTPQRAGQLPLDRVEALYRESSFLTRWRGQLQERFVKLSI
jgi:DnaJ-domain-containing protein 1